MTRKEGFRRELIGAIGVGNLWAWFGDNSWLSLAGAELGMRAKPEKLLNTS